MTTAMTKTLHAAALVTALGVASMGVSAMPFPDFDVTPTLGGGPLVVGTFTADKMTGNYVEVITLLAGNTFAVSLSWQAGQFVANDGLTTLNALTTGLGVNYGLYGLFQGTGTYSTVGVVTTFTLTGGPGLSLYLDPLLDTTFVAPVLGTLAWTTGSGIGVDDLLLGSGAPISGVGTLDPGLSTCIGGINCGSFGQSTGFSLTANGGLFFTDPSPASAFYNLTFESGQLNNFAISGTQTINGSLDAVFGQSVPEPATLALLGVGLLGLGMSRRGRKQA